MDPDWYKDWLVPGEDPSLLVAAQQPGAWADVWAMVQTYCEGWKDSPLDIGTFFLCLAAFSQPLKGRRDAVFQEKLILTAYHYSHFAFAAYQPSRKKVLHSLPFLLEDDFVAGEWDPEALGPAPGWCVVLDHDQKAVVLSLRGTKVLGDLLVDLASRFVPWRGGFVHQGFRKSMNRVEPMVLPHLHEQMTLFPSYRVRVAGHSMGAAVGALLCIKWREIYPLWEVKGYGFATPCCVSAGLARESETFFTTFVHHFDAVARLSMGSLQDLHNGMRLFSSRIGAHHDTVAIFRAVQYLATGHLAQEIKQVMEEIDLMIVSSIALQIGGTEKPTHLFPAGRTFQLWKEKRGHHFDTWQMYQSTLTDYGRLCFTSTMFRDHLSASYIGAFENMLSISVAEQRIYLTLNKTRRQDVREYWASWPCGDVFDEAFDWRPALEEMKRCSKFSKRAMKAGLVRPFLLLVSMSPKRRAAVSHLMGASLAEMWWYREFDSHHEAWHILTYHLKGLQPRSSSVLRKTNPLAHSSDWWMILFSCGHKVESSQTNYIPKDVKRLLKHKKKRFGTSIHQCQDPHNLEMMQLEETIHLLFLSLTDPDVSDQASLLQNESDPGEGVPPDEAKESAQRSQYLEQKRTFQDDPIYHSTVQLLKKRGYTLQMLIHKLAVQRAQESISKKANEMYAFGDAMRKREERWLAGGSLGMSGLAVLSGVLLLSIPAILSTFPPLVVIPVALGAIVALFALQSTPSGLISVVAACLEQRLALSYHGIDIDSFYK